MNELALFAGTGGGLLASHLLGFRTVCAVELDWYCRCVLTRRQNDGNLRPAFPIWDDIRTFDGRPWRGLVDIVTGGFPCQAYSHAAAGNNTADDLWPEMRRVVADVAPRYVFAENVSRVAIDQAADDLEQMGYQTKAVSLSAKDMGADHIRLRHWLLAHADNDGELLRRLHAETPFMQGMATSVWESAPGVPRAPDGLAYRVERIKATGNGQVPAVAATAFSLLAADFVGSKSDKSPKTGRSEDEMKPIAYVTGYYGGRLTIRPLDSSVALPVGLALYAHSDQDAKRYAYIRELDAGEISHLTHDLDGMRGEFLNARIDGILAAIRSAK